MNDNTPGYRSWVNNTPSENAKPENINYAVTMQICVKDTDTEGLSIFIQQKELNFYLN